MIQKLSCYLCFEHTELSKETFIHEQKLVATLKKLRETLENRKNLIKSFAKNVRGRDIPVTEKTTELGSITAFNVLKRSAVNLPFMKSAFKEALTACPKIAVTINETTSDFPSSDDYNGAVKGMVMLHETYELLLDATTEGKVSYFSSQNLYKEFQGMEKLDVDDLYTMASKATNQLLFDVGIEYLRAAFILAAKMKPSNSTMKS